MFVPVNRMLRNAGLVQSVQHNTPYPAENGYAIYAFGLCAGFNNGATIGTVKFTYYIRLHQRKYLG